MRAPETVRALGARAQVALAVLAGALGALGQAPLNIWPATFLSLALVYGLGRAAPGWRRAGLLGWAHVPDVRVA